MQLCSQCSRVNPPEAAYCYFDGSLLAGHTARGPVNPGAQLFPTPFYFPDGQASRNFDQLATACQQNWAIALDLLKQGFFTGFFGGLGRADLARAAQEAARFPDPERGFDQLLSKLPTQVLQPPKLKAEPTNLNLGVIPIGTDRSFDLHLANLGMRLLYGSVSSDCKWLTFGDAPGQPQKLFQFGAETVLPVHVRGQFLRAGTKPLEGSLLVESNGGSATINVKVDVPIIPFTEGVLAGSSTPRQVAEKAKAAPMDAAPFFENGAVARWFTQNGWTYPVQGPPASGLSAVQQFFEALGLAKAPKVEVTTPALSLEGDVGQALQATIEIRSEEKKPVFAHAVADRPWLDVSRVKLAGRFATISVVIAGIPNRPGETLYATIHVTGNGNQRFLVPLSLHVRRSDWINLAPQEAITPLSAEAVSVPAIPIPPPTVTAIPVSALPAQAIPIEMSTGTATLPASAPVVDVSAPRATTVENVADLAPLVVGVPPPATSRLWLHLIPLALLLLVLMAILLRDLTARSRPLSKQTSRGASGLLVFQPPHPAARISNT